ncbi:MAG: STAS domain-containing protein [Planctomycetota bacterium]
MNNHADYTQVKLTGRLDMAGVGAIDTKFYASISPRALPAIVDLSSVDLVTSLGIGMLVNGARTLKRRGGRMVLYGATGPVAETLQLAAVDQLLTLVATEAEAMAAIEAAT